MPCNNCGKEIERVVEYEVEPGKLIEVATLCPDCMANVLCLIHDEPPEYALGEYTPDENS